MLSDSELSDAMRALDTFQARTGAERAALVHVHGVALTPWDGSPHEPLTVAALAAAGFAANLEVAKLLLVAPLQSVRLGAGDEVAAVEVLSRTVLLLALYDLSRTSHEAVSGQLGALRDELRPILERVDGRGGDDHGGRLAPLRPGDPPRPSRPPRHAAE